MPKGPLGIFVPKWPRRARASREIRKALIRISGVGGRGLVVKRDERSGLVVGQVAGE